MGTGIDILEYVIPSGLVISIYNARAGKVFKENLFPICEGCCCER
jgi:hypothetical protein